jgi:lytic murein transglycosylase
MPFRFLLALMLCLAVLPATTSAQSAYRQKVETQFQHWLETTAWPDAKSRGISRATFKRATRGVKLNWKLPDLQPPGTSKKAAKQQRQSEFGSPSRYFNQKRLASQTAAGRRLMKRWAGTLRSIEQRYGVPRRILMAIWARESAFGRAKMPENTIRALATESFMGRRPQLFYPEFIAALRILQRGDISPERMRGSWAGALGQPQFLPTKFLTLAVDFDGDGRRDIWDSVPDTLASIANYLKKSGWQPGRDWGFEANVPASVSCALEGPDLGKTFAEWVRLGVTRPSGRPFPAREMKRKGFLLMPAGRKGPAFIATQNFYTLKEYNESDLYALYIGNLADRFGKGGNFYGKWGRIGGFNRRDVHNMQQRLERLGHDVGGTDGLAGFKTRRSIGKWQQANGLKPTCFPDAQLVRAIR